MKVIYEGLKIPSTEEIIKSAQRIFCVRSGIIAKFTTNDNWNFNMTNDADMNTVEVQIYSSNYEIARVEKYKLKEFSNLLHQNKKLFLNEKTGMATYKAV